MPSVVVKLKYSETGGTPTCTGTKSVDVSSKNPTESEVNVALKKKYPKMNYIILKIG